MGEDINFRKLLLICAVLGGGAYWARLHLHMSDLFAYAKARPEALARQRDIYYVATLYWMKGDNEQAIEAYNALLADSPTSQYAPRSLMRLGGCYRNMYKFPESKAAYEKYMEDFPNGEDIVIVRNNYEYVKFR